MLQACGQSVQLQDIPSMKDFMAAVTDTKEVVKLGEGTYGEAFKSGSVVFKLVPMEGDNLTNGWPQKGAADLLGEAVIAIALSGLGEEADAAGNPYPSHTQAFVKTHRVGVCRGPYPQSLIKAWRAWHKKNKSENDPIEGFPRDQLYAVFAMANCGKDLEGYCLQGYDEARAMMLQVALALAVAEDSLAFEHRDLHWGNVMLRPAAAAANSHVTARLRGSTLRAATCGAEVTLIDFTASRLQTPGGDMAFCNLEAEEGLFDGPKGKSQFETYRRMRKLTATDWAGSYPGTNVLWMQYLAELLLSSDKPIPGASTAQKRGLREFKKRLAGYSSCGEVIWDELFSGLLEVVQQ
ncbi:hypothetical protein OEZ85_012851 [Tetradesmus obliquus]|uniref:non-specific serine/threonine protein kinase n=1 Tax=Tetradesmus obliquus TaxID=3088 RepID=A0ABY8U668_TETOB|nr:hypothetical protein OEZ85_012851 [Tetradesmus obliquus]